MTKINDLTKADKTRRMILFYAVLVIAFVIVGYLVPKDTEDFGIISALPAAFLIVYIFKTKRIIEALALATLLTTIMGYQGDFFGIFNEFY